MAESRQVKNYRELELVDDAEYDSQSDLSMDKDGGRERTSSRSNSVALDDHTQGDVYSAQTSPDVVHNPQIDALELSRHRAGDIEGSWDQFTSAGAYAARSAGRAVSDVAVSGYDYADDMADWATSPAARVIGEDFASAGLDAAAIMLREFPGFVSDRMDDTGDIFNKFIDRQAVGFVRAVSENSAAYEEGLDERFWSSMDGRSKAFREAMKSDPDKSREHRLERAGEFGLTRDALLAEAGANGQGALDQASEYLDSRAEQAKSVSSMESSWKRIFDDEGVFRGASDRQAERYEETYKRSREALANHKRDMADRAKKQNEFANSRPGPPNTRAHYEHLIRAASDQWGVPTDRIAAIAHTESRFRPLAMSDKGAKGLMQFMPGTAKQYGLDDPYDAATSLMAASHYLRDLYDRYGDWDVATAAYNAGPTAIDAAGGEIPNWPETQNYVKSVNSYMETSQMKRDK